MKKHLFLLIIFSFIPSCKSVDSIDLTPESADILSEITIPEPAENSFVSREPSQDEFYRGISEGFKVVETSHDSDHYDEESVNNSSNFRAFFSCKDFCNIFIEDLKEEKLYMLEAPSFIPGRPFSNLNWSSEYILEFDQAIQPHQKVHYVVDVGSKMLVDAYPVYLP